MDAVHAHNFPNNSVLSRLDICGCLLNIGFIVCVEGIYSIDRGFFNFMVYVTWGKSDYYRLLDSGLEIKCSISKVRSVLLTHQSGCFVALTNRVLVYMSFCSP